MHRIFFFLFLFLSMACQNEILKEAPANLVTQDIAHFWEAYDSIQTTKDSVQQAAFLQRLFLDRASPGQLAMLEVRRYQLGEYIQAINSYPAFWQKMRQKMAKASAYAQEIQEGIDRFARLYPSLKVPTVYFTVGVFRSPGTTLDSMVLIGSEMVLGDHTVPTDEFPESLQYFTEYLQTDPNAHLAFLNVHEVVHTQQKDHPYVLLYRSVYEGIAEFLAEQIMEEASTSKALTYGQEHAEAVRNQFIKEMWTSAGMSNWLYNNKENPFQTRDLGYYVGYTIANGYYEQAEQADKAVQELLEIDYLDTLAFYKILDRSGYFPQPVAAYQKAYDASRPQVVAIDPPFDKTSVISPGEQVVTVTFSEPMDPTGRGFDYAPMGEEHTLFVEEYLGFSEDSLQVQFRVKTEPNRHYQLVLTNGFRAPGIREITPYLIEVKTGPKNK